MIVHLFVQDHESTGIQPDVAELSSQVLDMLVQLVCTHAQFVVKHPCMCAAGMYTHTFR